MFSLTFWKRGITFIVTKKLNDNCWPQFQSVIKFNQLNFDKSCEKYNNAEKQSNVRVHHQQLLYKFISIPTVNKRCEKATGDFLFMLYFLEKSFGSFLFFISFVRINASSLKWNKWIIIVSCNVLEKHVLMKTIVILKRWVWDLI